MLLYERKEKTRMLLYGRKEKTEVLLYGRKEKTSAGLWKDRENGNAALWKEKENESAGLRKENDMLKRNLSINHLYFHSSRPKFLLPGTRDSEGTSTATLGGTGGSWRAVNDNHDEISFYSLT